MGETFGIKAPEKKVIICLLKLVGLILVCPVFFNSVFGIHVVTTD